MASNEDVMTIFDAQDNISPKVNTMTQNIQKMGIEGVGAVADVSQSLQDMNNLVSNGISLLTGGKSIWEEIVGTTAKAQSNNVLLENMAGTAEGAEKLKDVVDEVTNNSLISMQSLIPALNTIKSATGANADEISNISDEVANFGTFVLAMKGSTAEAETAMMDLSKGIKGSFASLDQYGITEDSLKKTGFWKGEEEDVEGYMKAVRSVVGDTSALLNTYTGLTAKVQKHFSKAGKDLGNSLALPILQDALNKYLEIDDAMGNKLSKSILIVGAGLQTATQSLSAFGTSFAGLKSMIGMFDEIGMKMREFRGGEVQAPTVSAPSAPISTQMPEMASENAVIAENTALKQANLQVTEELSLSERRNGRGYLEAIISEKEESIAIAENNTAKMSQFSLNDELTYSEKAYAMAYMESMAAVDAETVAEYENIASHELADTTLTGLIRTKISDASASLKSAFATTTSTLAKLKDNIATNASRILHTNWISVIWGGIVAKLGEAKALVVSSAMKAKDAFQTGILNKLTWTNISATLKSAAAKMNEVLGSRLSSAAKSVEAAKTRLLNTATLQNITASLKSIPTKIKDSIASLTSASAKTTEAEATEVATASQNAFNSSLLANPLVWVIGLLVATALAVYEVGKAFGWWKNVDTMLDSIKSGVGRLYEAFVNSQDVKDAINWIKTSISELQSWLGSQGVNIAGIINPDGGEVDAVQMIIDMGSKIGDALRGVFTGLQPTIEQFKSSLGTLFVGLQQAWVNLQPGLSAMADMINNVISAITGQNPGAIDWWVTLGQVIGLILTPLSTLITVIGWLAPVVGSALSTAMQLFSSFVNFVIPIGQAVYSALKPIVCILLGCSPGIVPALNTVNSVFQSVFGFLSGFLSGIVPTITSILGGIVTILTPIWTGIQFLANIWVQNFLRIVAYVNLVITIVFGFVSTMLQLPSKVASALGAVLGSVSSWASSMVSRALSAGHNFANSLRSGLSSAPGMVRSELSRIGSEIVSLGGELGQKARNMAADIVNQMKAGLGIGSPGYMYYMMEGELNRISYLMERRQSLFSMGASALGQNIVTGFSNPIPQTNVATIDTIGSGLSTQQNTSNNYTIIFGEGSMQIDARDFTPTEAKQIVITAFEGIADFDNIYTKQGD